MARINIEDSLFKDPRFYELCIHLKSRTDALGTLVWAFIVAQKYYTDQSSDRLIPLSEWKRSLCSDYLITCGFAEIRGMGVYVSGSEKQFSWLLQRIEAGRKGGLKSKIQRKEKATAKRPSGGREASYSLNTTIKENKHNRRTISERVENLSDEGAANFPSSDVESFDALLSSDDLRSLTSKKKITDSQKNLNSLIFEAYENSFLARYSEKPTRNAFVNKIVSNLGKRLGKDAIEVVKFYLLHNHTFYVGKMHDLRFCLNDAESLHLQWKKGKAITNRDLKSFDKNITHSEIMQKIERGEL